MADQDISETTKVTPNLPSSTTESEALKNEFGTPLKEAESPVDNQPAKVDNIVSEKSAIGNELGIKTQEWTSEDEEDEQNALKEHEEKMKKEKENKTASTSPTKSMTLKELNEIQKGASLPLSKPQPLENKPKVESSLSEETPKIDDVQTFPAAKPQINSEPLPIVKPEDRPTVPNMVAPKIDDAQKVPIPNVQQTPQKEQGGGFFSRFFRRDK